MIPGFIIFIAYLIGSVPFGYIIVRIWKDVDIRETGSGGTGATNVIRGAGKLAGILTLILDVLKGVAAIVLARWVLTLDYGFNWWVAACVIAVLLGHVFPVWLNFRGGKGVATGLGVFLSVSPIAALCSLLIFLIVVGLSRYVSLGSILAAATFPLWVWLLEINSLSSAHFAPLLMSAIIGSLIIILMHHANIKRLLLGNENKFY
jgi:acyl phosphate:glycerol-3-phosphate acyltransferase